MQLDVSRRVTAHFIMTDAAPAPTRLKQEKVTITPPDTRRKLLLNNPEEKLSATKKESAET